MNESKQYDIPKRAVIEAYKRVKANKGSAGIDGIDADRVLALQTPVSAHYFRANLEPTLILPP